MISFIRCLMLGAIFFVGCVPKGDGPGTYFTTERQELALGEQNYTLLIQAQGGLYNVDSDLSQYVKKVGHAIAAQSRRPDYPYDFVVINSSVPNAWSLPGGRIGLNRGLLVELESEAELAAVLSHEIAHATSRHSVRRMEKQTLFGAVVSIISAAGGSDVAVGASQVGAQLISAKFSRTDELEADRVGMSYMAKAGYDLQGAVLLQETFLRLQSERSAGWLAGLFASHPPSNKRLEENRKIASELGAGGVLGRSEYQRVMAGLARQKSAYAAADQGNKELAERKPRVALNLGKKALALAPNEAQVHSLIGRSYQAMNQMELALQALNQAIELNPGYFMDYYSRAQVNYATGGYRQAHQDVSKSLRLLDTSQARGLLAKITPNL